MTVGFVREAAWIVRSRGQKTHFQISGTVEGINDSLSFYISPDFWMEVSYEFEGKSELIWEEKIDGNDSFFGIESCDAISRIIACIQNRDSSWKERYPSPKRV